MKTAKVVVLPYDKEWKNAFENIKAQLEAACADLIEGIEHVGSTSVEGLSAKPCIDIDLIIRDSSVFPAVAARLRSIGYYHEGDLGIRGREAFAYSDKPSLMKHHLYVCCEDSEELHRHIVFRDFLRSHPTEAEEYGAHKQRAAELFPDSIDHYIAYKAPCIERLYRKCGLLDD